jgi:hypothetical protein
MEVPSCGLLNCTPSSVTLASFSSDTIWNLHPPRQPCPFLSVRSREMRRISECTDPPLSAAPISKCTGSLVASSQPVNRLCLHPCSRCAPPTASSTLCPGFRPRWYVLLRHSRQPVASSCSGVRPLRLPCVATGMKMGSGTAPCGRCSVEARAFVFCACVFRQIFRLREEGSKIRCILRGGRSGGRWGGASSLRVGWPWMGELGGFHVTMGGREVEFYGWTRA